MSGRYHNGNGQVEGLEISEEAEQVSAKLGDLLGVKLTPAVSSFISLGINYGLGPLRRFAGEYGSKLGGAAAGLLNQKHKEHGAHWGGKIAQYAAIAIPQILDLAATTKTNAKRLKEIGANLQPVLSLHGQKTPSLILLMAHSWKDNTIFAEERDVIFNHVKSDITNDLVGFVRAVPHIVAMHTEYSQNELLKSKGLSHEDIEKEWKGLPNQEKHSEPFYGRFDEYKEHRIETEAPQLVTKFKDDEEKLKKWNQYGPIGGQAATEVLTQVIKANHEDGEHSQTTGRMIVALQDAWKREPDPESLPKQIEQILEFHQQKHGFKKLPRHAMSKVAEQLADAIVDDHMDPGSLAYLIGEGKIFVNAKKGELASEEVVSKAIAAEMKQCKTGVEVLDLATYYKDAVVAKDTLKQILEAAQDNKQEMALLAGIIPPEVVRDLTGMSKKELRALKKRTHSLFKQEIEGLVVELVGKSEDELRAMKLTTKDISAIQELGARMKEEGDRALMEVLNGTDSENKAQKSAIEDAVVRSWAARVKETGGRRDRDVGEEELDGMKPFKAEMPDDDSPHRKHSKHKKRNPREEILERGGDEEFAGRHAKGRRDMGGDPPDDAYEYGR